MPIPNQPRKGEGPASLHFRYTPTDKGTTWHAFLAGDPHWLYCHTKGRSKPCLTVLTDGKLRCARCEILDLVERISYVPLYREIDSKPVCVICHEDVEEQLDKLRFHQRVVVGRESGEADGVWIAPSLKPSRFETTHPVKQRRADLTRSLLAMWKLPELTDWYQSSAFALGDSAAVTTGCHSTKEEPIEKEHKPEKRQVSNGELAEKVKSRITVVPPSRGEPPLIGEVLPSYFRTNGKPH